MQKLLTVIDFETSGLTLHPDADMSLQPKIIEFAGALMSLDNGEVVDKFQTLVHPRESITPEITKITGITNEMLANEKHFVEQLPAIRGFFAKGHAMCSHNLPFDRAVLRGELVRFGVKDFPWPKKEFCTVGMYRERYGFNPKLTLLYEDVIGHPLVQTHRAMSDVDALVEIIREEELWRFMQ